MPREAAHDVLGHPLGAAHHARRPHGLVGRDQDEPLRVARRRRPPPRSRCRGRSSGAPPADGPRGSARACGPRRGRRPAADARGTPRASARDRGRRPGPTIVGAPSSVTNRSCRWVSSLSKSARRAGSKLRTCRAISDADGPAGAGDEHAPASQELTNGREVRLDLPPTQEVLDPQVAEVAGRDAARRRSRGPRAAPAATPRPLRTGSRRRGSGRSWRSGSPAAAGRRSSCRASAGIADRPPRTVAPWSARPRFRGSSSTSPTTWRPSSGWRWMSLSTWAPASPAPISSTRVPAVCSTERRRNPKRRLWNRIAPKTIIAAALPSTTTESGSGCSPPRPTSRSSPSTNTKLVTPDRTTRLASCTPA